MLPMFLFTVPSRRLSVINSDGTEIDSIVGPLREEAALRLTCTAEGGSPPPRVTWWDAERLLDGTSSSRGQLVTTTLMVEPRKVSNTLLLEPLSRDDLHRSLTCKASNTNLSAPLSTTVSIDMTRELIDNSKIFHLISHAEDHGRLRSFIH